jgi:coproporphyrinogen III oxidase-like Fe-S oxidoreductase
VRERARATVLELERQGWIEEHGERWKLSARGLPLADAIAREFLRLGEARGPRE